MEKRNVYISAGLTALICAIILVLLFLFGFSVPLPLPEEKGVVIEVGGGGGGGMEEILKDDIAEIVESQQAAAVAEENVVTQNTEDVNYTVPEKTVVSDKKVEVKTPAKPTPDQRVQNFKWGSGGGTGTGSGTGSGTGEGSGSGTGIGSGSGSGAGSGNGVSFNLKGRSAKKIPKPQYTEDDQGKVVVAVWVDKDGNVTRAEAGQVGSTISNPALWEKAKRSALQAKFSVDQDAPEIQKGTITYTFIKTN